VKFPPRGAIAWSYIPDTIYAVYRYIRTQTVHRSIIHDMYVSRLPFRCSIYSMYSTYTVYSYIVVPFQKIVVFGGSRDR